MIVAMGNYKVKAVSVKTDLKGSPVGYSIIVCPKTNEEYTTSFFYTLEDAKTIGIMNKDQAMALVGQSCQILKTLKLN